MENKLIERLNPENFKNSKPVIKVGNMYPNLYTQATHQNEKLNNISERIIKEIDSIRWSIGFECVSILIDSMHKSIQEKVDELKENGSDIGHEDLQKITHHVFSVGEYAKSMMNIMDLHQTMNRKGEEINLTQNNILL